MGHSERIWAIAFSPDGQSLASGGEDCSIRLWDLATGNCYAVWQAHDRWVRSLAFSPDGKHLASCSYDQTIKLWDIQTQDCIRTLHGHRQPLPRSPSAPMVSSFLVAGLIAVLNSGRLLRENAI
jgi:WD40 repeat protein